MFLWLFFIYIVSHDISGVIDEVTFSGICLLHCEKIHYTMVSGGSVDCSSYIHVKGSTLLSM